MPPRPVSDAIIAVVLGTAGVATQLGSDSELSWAVTVPMTLAYATGLALRRRAPLVAPVCVLLLVVALGLIDREGSQPTIVLVIGLAAYTLGHDATMPASAIALGVGLGAVGIGIAAIDGPASDVLGTTLVLGAPWAFGRALRARTDRAADQRERAVEEERLRIARELHDVVSHSISVISVQSQAVRRRLGPEHAQEAEQLRAIETAARDAMAEMRRLFGVLRANGVTAPLAPQPGIRQLSDLVTAAREQGLEVHERVQVEHDRVSPGLDLTAYRVVQEAMTNVRRHAAAQRVEVSVRTCGNALEVIVFDDGLGARAGGAGPGHGLRGMRERVALYDGSIEAGPAPEGGYRVHAVLPLTQRAAP